MGGVRIAIGATRARVIRMVLSQGACLTAVGLAIGVGLVVPLARNVVPRIVVGADALNIAGLFVVAALLSAAMMAACWIPARRASRVDPTKALRQE